MAQQFATDLNFRVGDETAPFVCQDTPIDAISIDRIVLTYAAVQTGLSVLDPDATGFTILTDGGYSPVTHGEKWWTSAENVACQKPFVLGVGPSCRHPTIGAADKKTCIKEVKGIGQRIMNNYLYNIYTQTFLWTFFGDGRLAPFSVLWDTTADVEDVMKLLEDYFRQTAYVHYTPCFCNEFITVTEFKQNEEDPNDEGNLGLSISEEDGRVVDLSYGDFFGPGNVVWMKEETPDTISMLVAVNSAYKSEDLQHVVELKSIVFEETYVYKDGVISRDAGDDAEITFITNPDRGPIIGNPGQDVAATGLRDTNYVYMKNIRKSFITGTDLNMFYEVSVPTTLKTMTEDLVLRAGAGVRDSYVDPALDTQIIQGVRYSTEKTFGELYKQTAEIFSVVYSQLFNRLYFSRPITVDFTDDPALSYLTTTIQLKIGEGYEKAILNFFRHPDFFEKVEITLSNIDSQTTDEVKTVEYNGVLSNNVAAAYITKTLYNTDDEKEYTAVISPHNMALIASDYIKLGAQVFHVRKTELDSVTLKTKVYLTEVSPQLYQIVETDSTTYTFDATPFTPQPIPLPIDPGELIFFPIPEINYPDSNGEQYLITFITMFGFKQTDPAKQLIGIVSDAAAELPIVAIDEPLIFGELLSDVAVPKSNWRTDNTNSITIEFSNAAIHAQLAPREVVEVLNDPEVNVLLIDHEVIQFQKYTVVTGNTIKFEVLYRGRRGTNDAPQAHTAGIECYLYTPGSIKKYTSTHYNRELLTYEPFNELFREKEVVTSPFPYRYVANIWQPEPSYMFRNRNNDALLVLRMRSSFASELIPRGTEGGTPRFDELTYDMTVTDPSTGDFIFEDFRGVFIDEFEDTSIYGNVTTQSRFYVNAVFRNDDIDDLDLYTYPLTLTVDMTVKQTASRVAISTPRYVPVKIEEYHQISLEGYGR